MSNDNQGAFYSSGLRFKCTRCSACCRNTPGYVFLSDRDCAAICEALGISRQDFLIAYCRRIPLGLVTRISLKEKANLDCIFWKEDGCSVYEARPLQCRSFPFWSSCLASQEEWSIFAAQCPGIGKGPVHTANEIERWLAQRVEDGLLEG